MTTDAYDELENPDEEPTGMRRPERALTIGAHPDDAEFGAGATLARWAAEGTKVTMCIVTDGSKGSWDATIPDEDLIATRRHEQAMAADVLAAIEVIHLGHVDGDLVASPELRDELAGIIRKVKPNVVLTHDPWQRYQLHPDHRATGTAAVDAVVAAREPRALREGASAHRPDAILLWSADTPDHVEPVDQRFFDRKVAALLCHSSQASTTMADAGSSDSATEDFIRRLWDWQVSAGRTMGTGPAETFKRLTP